MPDSTPATAAPVFAAPNVPAVLRRAADDLESRPWLKPVEALRLWADALEMESEGTGIHKDPATGGSVRRD